MITKKTRNNEGCFDVKVTDRKGNSFTMTVGGNGDLYWIPKNHKQNRVFEIEKSDDITYRIFDQLFNTITKVDDKYRPVVNGNTITFISEDMPEDEANVLKIIKNEGLFTIQFIKNENKNEWGFTHTIGCDIRFCNSGSRVPVVEAMFMRLFSFLAYDCAFIPQEEEKTI